MEFRPLAIPEVILVVPDVYRDARGFFQETWHARRYAEAGLEATFVQDNHSRSSRGVLRGLHAQVRRPQGKLIRAARGEVYDVAVDIRPGSQSFGRWVGAHLREEDAHQLWIPPGFAHGFQVLSEVADVEYKCTEFYDPDDEITIRWEDPQIGIAWPLAEPELSERDRKARPLAECVAQLRAGGGQEESA